LHCGIPTDIATVKFLSEINLKKHLDYILTIELNFKVVDSVKDLKIEDCIFESLLDKTFFVPHRIIFN